MRHPGQPRAAADDRRLRCAVVRVLNRRPTEELHGRRGQRTPSEWIAVTSMTSLSATAAGREQPREPFSEQALPDPRRTGRQAVVSVAGGRNFYR
jgi:hypothetical protein